MMTMLLCSVLGLGLGALVWYWAQRLEVHLVAVASLLGQLVEIESAESAARGDRVRMLLERKGAGREMLLMRLADRAKKAGGER